MGIFIVEDGYIRLRSGEGWGERGITNSGVCGSPPFLTLPHKGGGNRKTARADTLTIELTLTLRRRRRRVRSGLRHRGAARGSGGRCRTFAEGGPGDLADAGQ